MPHRDIFVSHLLDMLREFGQVRAQAMFGGHGIYRDGTIFAIVVNSTLYIKADENNRALFEEKRLPRFSYRKNGKECFMSYYMVPEEAMEDMDELYYWSGKGYEASLRSKNPHQTAP